MNSIGSLAETDLVDFIRSNAAPDAFWLFLHIPKTAGSSLSAELNDIRPPYRNVHLSAEDYQKDAQGEAFWHLLDGHIDALIDEQQRTRYRSASGHMLAPQAFRIARAIEGTRLFTFLRDPVARVVSDYRYQLSGEHPAHAAFRAAHPTIDSYLATADADKMTRHLCLHPREPIDEVIGRVGETFSFVGIVEMYPFSFNVLSRLFGENRMPRRQERVASAETRGAVTMTAELETRILEMNRRDLALYQHFRRLLGRHRDSWLAMQEHETVA